MKTRTKLARCFAMHELSKHRLDLQSVSVEPLQVPSTWYGKCDTDVFEMTSLSVLGLRCIVEKWYICVWKHYATKPADLLLVVQRCELSLENPRVWKLQEKDLAINIVRILWKHSPWNKNWDNLLSSWASARTGICPLPWKFGLRTKIF